MYEHIFHSYGLRENPFGVSPDPRFYVPTSAHEAALAALRRGIEEKQNFTVLTGEAGTGKTILLNHFLDWLRERRRSSAYVFHPRLKPVELFDCILRDFGIPHQSLEKEQLLETLTLWLIRRQAVGDTPVVVIDEAQAISIRTLDQLRWLLSLAASGKKLLQIVLVGQPELAEKLARPELRKLRKRVTCHCSLEPFSPEETSLYVKARLTSTGAPNPYIFSSSTLELIHGYARGIPRTVNLLCEQMLIAAHGAGATTICAEAVRKVAEEYDLAPRWVDSEEREVSSKFTRLLTPASENLPRTPVPVDPIVETSAVEMTVSEPVHEIPLESIEQPADLEPTLLLAQPEVQFEANEHPSIESIETDLQSPLNALQADGRPLTDPEIVPQTVRARSPRIRFGEQRAGLQNGLRANLTRARTQVRKQFTLAMASKNIALAAIRRNWTVAMTNAAQSFEEMGERWTRRIKAWQARFADSRAEFMTRFTKVMPSKDRVVAKIQNDWSDLVKNAVQSFEKLREGWARRSKALETRLARNWAEFRTRFMPAMPSGDPVVPRIKISRAGLLRTAGDSAEKLTPGERWAQWLKRFETRIAYSGAQIKTWLTMPIPSKDLAGADVRSKLPSVVRKTARPSEELRQMSPPAKFRNNGTIERVLWYAKGVRESFMRDWKRLIYNSSSASATAVPAASNLPQIGPTIVKLPENLPHETREKLHLAGSSTGKKEQIEGRWSPSRERFVLNSEQFVERPGSVPQENREPRLSADFRKARQSAQSGEKFIRYCREVRASFLRDWKQLMNANGSEWIAARKRR